MARNRIRRSQAQWRQLIQEQQNSGESIAEFCKQRNLCESRFYIWRKQLVAEANESSAAPFIEYPTHSPASPEPAILWDIELDLDGVVLRIRRS